MGRITPLDLRKLSEFQRGQFERAAGVSVIVPPGLHPDAKELVRAFAEALADKLHGAQIKHGYGNNWLVDDWQRECQRQLVRHLVNGDPRDLAAYAAFLWAREWPLPTLECASILLEVERRERANSARELPTVAGAHFGRGD
jgi:hypothetical protein